MAHCAVRDFIIRTVMSMLTARRLLGGDPHATPPEDHGQRDYCRTQKSEATWFRSAGRPGRNYCGFGREVVYRRASIQVDVYRKCETVGGVGGQHRYRPGLVGEHAEG